MGGFELPDFVLDSHRWMTDCCWLMLTIQNERPLHPETQLVDAAEVNGLEWAFYDTGSCDGRLAHGAGTMKRRATTAGILASRRCSGQGVWRGPSRHR
jgi:hypothetical protein